MSSENNPSVIPADTEFGQLLNAVFAACGHLPGVSPAEQVAMLKAECDRQANEMRALVTEVQELRARECPGCGKCMDRYCPQCQMNWQSATPKTRDK